MTATAQGLRVRVARKEIAAADIALFELVSVDGRALAPFSPGSHIDVAVPGGFTRQYSLCNDSAETHRYQIAVLSVANGRGGSSAMHAHVSTGDEIVISPPKNHFALNQSATKSILLAGGIGITPVLCMAERLCAMSHPFELHYCTRSAQRTAFRERIELSPYRDNVHFHFDDGPAQQKLEFAQLLRTPEAGTHVYVCGPKGFMDAALGAARQSGWSESQLHYEFFNAQPPTLAEEGGFEVQLASSGRVVPVTPGQTVVDALAAQGVVIPTSCQQGVCGTCLTRVLDGEPDHRDLYLMPDERAANNQFLPCCSRARSPRLVLDL
jgi:vanillate monooxygenase ferredoxin subunit